MLWGEVQSPESRVQGSVQLLRCAYNTPICGFRCLLCMTFHPKIRLLAYILSLLSEILH